MNLLFTLNLITIIRGKHLSAISDTNKQIAFKESLLRRVTHEMRTPLVGLYGVLNSLKPKGVHFSKLTQTLHYQLGSLTRSENQIIYIATHRELSTAKQTTLSQHFLPYAQVYQVQTKKIWPPVDIQYFYDLKQSFYHDPFFFNL